MNDRQYLAILNKRIRERGLERRAPGSAADWANESHTLARAALVPDGGAVNEAYYQAHLPALEERLALAGLRLAQLLNQAFSSPAPGGATR